MNRERKRIRGLRRYFRHLRQRAKQPNQLQPIDITWLTRFQQTSLNVISDPWPSCKCVPRQQEFRALWLERFIRTFSCWHAQLKSKYDDFYLAVYLYEPTPESFCDSQLRAAVNENRLLYENIFGVAQNRPLPVEYLTVPGIETLSWRAYANWSSSYTLEEFARAGVSLSDKLHKVVETEWGEPGIIVLLGWVWVGKKYE